MDILKKVTAISMLLITVSCSCQNNSTREQNEPPKGGHPSIDDIFKMDTNADGKLSKSEIKGPLLNDFDKIDTDEDGFISREELENAPKPERPNQPPNR